MTEKEIPHLRELADRRREADARLIAAIREELDKRDGRGLSLIARSVGWTPQYIAKIRDGKVRTTAD